MNNLYPGRVDWTAMSTAVGIVIGLVVTGLVTGLLYKAFPRFRRPQVFFWVMLGLLLVTSIGSMVVLTPLQARNQAQHNQAQHNQAQHNQAQHNQAQHNQAQHNQAQHNQAQHNQAQGGKQGAHVP